MTQDTSMRARLETLIRQLLEYAGQTYHGQEYSSEIKISQNNHTTVIIHTVSCAKSSVMAQTMADSPTPSPNNPTSLSESLRISNQSISGHFLAIYDGKITSMSNFEELGRWFHLLVVSEVSLEGATILIPSEKLLHMTLKEV